MKYWAYVNNEILGPYEKEKLLQLPSFSASLLICPQTPVGEKTEDWKEASGYPEIAAAMGGSIQQAAPAAAQAAAPSFETSPSPISASGHKSLTAASIDPVPPRESAHGGIELEVNKLERSGRFSISQPVGASQGSSTDPISLSSINRKADTLSSGLSKEPKPAFSAQAAQAGGIDIGLPPRDASGPAIAGGAQVSFASEPAAAPSFGAAAPFGAPAPVPAAAPAPAPSYEAPAAQAPAAAMPAAAMSAAGPVPGMEELNRKIDMLAMNSVSRQDLAAIGDLRMKLDQMGEVLANIKTSQFQSIIEKLSYLENTVAELKSARAAAPAPAPAPAAEPLAFVNPFAASQAAAAANPAPAPEKKPEPDGKKTVIVDQGSKPGIGAKIGGLVKKVVKLVVTLALLGGVLYGAAVGLKMANVFDITAMVPALAGLPGLPAPAAPAEEPAVAESTSTVKAEPVPAEKKPVDISPEIIYFVRNYTAAPNGPRLEDKVTEIAAAAGGTYNPANWTVKNTGPDAYDAATVIPLKSGSVTFTFSVDHAKKTLAPADSSGKAAFDALTPQAGKKGRGRRGAKAAASQPAEAAAPAVKGKAAVKTAAPAGKAAKGKKTVKPAEEEYEYEYEEE